MERDTAKPHDPEPAGHASPTEPSVASQVKSIKFNLTDSKNSDFRARVVAGEIAPEQMPKLTSTQMAGRVRPPSPFSSVCAHEI